MDQENENSNSSQKVTGVEDQAGRKSTDKEVSTPQELHGKDINLKRPEAEIEPDAEVGQQSDVYQDISPEDIKATDDTMTQKKAMRMLGFSTNDAEKNLEQLKRQRQRELFMFYLLETEKGKKELDAYVKKKAKELKERGLDGIDVRESMTSSIMSANLDNMKKMFPGVDEAIRQERDSIDIEAEFSAIRDIEPTLGRTDSEAAELKQELREIKQHDNRYLGKGDPAMVQRIIDSKLSYGEVKNKPFPWGKAVKGSLLAIGGIAAFGSGGAPAVAMFVATKGVTAMAMRMIDKSEEIKASVDSSLLKSGVVTEQDIATSDKQMAERAKGGKWKRVAAIGALAVASFAVGDAMDGTSKLADLWEAGKEIVSAAPGLEDHAYSEALDGLGVVPDVSSLDPEAVEAAVNLAENASDPVSDVAKEAGDLVAEGSTLDADAVNAGVEIAQEAAQEVKAESVLHDIQPGDTASQIAYDYLKERGISVTAADLYGSDGILAKTGLDQDLILAGDQLDLTALDQYVQDLSVDHAVPSADSASMAQDLTTTSTESVNKEAAQNFVENLKNMREQPGLENVGKTFHEAFGRGMDMPSGVDGAFSAASAAQQGAQSADIDEVMLKMTEDLGLGEGNVASTASSPLEEASSPDVADAHEDEYRDDGPGMG